MKPARKTPDDQLFVKILSLAREGQPRNKLADATAIPEPQFRRCMAALVDREFVQFDAGQKAWFTTAKGLVFLKARSANH
jgi:DNA-binding IclR family transcriptional regulator